MVFALTLGIEVTGSLQFRGRFVVRHLAGPHSGDGDMRRDWLALRGDD